MKNIKIKRPYKLWKRGDREGVYYIKPKNGGPWKSTGSKDKDKAIEWADAECGCDDNENAMHHKKVAEAHLMKCNPEWVTNTWDAIAQRAINAPRQIGKVGKKRASTVITMTSYWNGKRWDNIRHKRCIDTVAADFEKSLKGAGLGLIEFGQLLHNHATDHNLIPYPVMGKKCWPRAIRKNMSRALTEEDHRTLLKHIQDPQLAPFKRASERNLPTTPKQWRDEWENWFWFLWWTGASNKDAANIRAEDIDWKANCIKFSRTKTSTKSTVAIGQSLRTLLKKLPTKGYLFPCLQNMTTSNRSRTFRILADWCGLEKVTLHGYRFGWAERAKETGMTTEDRMASLGHKTPQMAAHYDEGADYIPASIEIIEGGLKAA